ncbi:hypothetical protein BDR07DRAFT_55183 [Suillus spraguei]|nr:hypothetical protein BDR07DRAFT_55183 [Suillus spraguei]
MRTCRSSLKYRRNGIETCRGSFQYRRNGIRTCSSTAETVLEPAEATFGTSDEPTEVVLDIASSM